MLLSAYMQIFGYSTLKIQCTAILLDRMNLNPCVFTHFVGVHQLAVSKPSLVDSIVYNRLTQTAVEGSVERNLVCCAMAQKHCSACMN